MRGVLWWPLVVGGVVGLFGTAVVHRSVEVAFHPTCTQLLRVTGWTFLGVGASLLGCVILLPELRDIWPYAVLPAAFGLVLLATAVLRSSTTCAAGAVFTRALLVGLFPLSMGALLLADHWRREWAPHEALRLRLRVSRAGG